MTQEEIQKLIGELSKLQKVEIQYVILELMKTNKINYQDITVAYIFWLEYAKKEAAKNGEELRNHVIDIWFGKKQDIRTNLKKTMHWLLDKGWINATHEQIDNKM